MTNTLHACRTQEARVPRLARAIWLVVLICACTRGVGADTPQSSTAEAQKAHSSQCPARRNATFPLPGVSAESTTLSGWLSRFTPAQLDQPLLTAVEIDAYNADVGRRPGRDVVSQRDLRIPVDAITLASDVHARLAQLLGDIDASAFVQRDGSPVPPATRAAFAAPLPTLMTSLRVVLEPVTLRCGPFDGGLFKPPVVAAFDKNACGALTAQEPVELLAQYPGGLWLARSRYSLGWLAASAALSPPLGAADIDVWIGAPRLATERDVQLTTTDGGRVTLPRGTLLPLLPSGEVLVATRAGSQRGDAPAGTFATRRPLTRRALLEAAFARIGGAYGLGDTEGGRDCSGLQLSLFDTFGIALPRHSGWQAEAGNYAVDVSKASEAQKLAQLDLAADSGIVLLYLPGHIMLYLGRSAAGAPMALHSLGEYAEPCAAGGETIVDVQRVVVSTLELGRGSSRRSLLERITRLVVFGKAPPTELHNALVQSSLPPRRPAPDAACADTTDSRIFVSPGLPLAGQPARIMATTMRRLDGMYLRAWDDRGAAPRMDELRLGGPPYTRVLRMPSPQAGTYTVVLGNEQTTLACKRIRIRKDALAPQQPAAHAPLWEPRWQWEPDTENLWAAFVERLFDGAADDETTWTNLHSLLQDPNRNLLYDHLGMQEDSALVIEPDCADLPYTLRAYFAWKLRLPYAFRSCARGRDGVPPTCGELHTTLDPRSDPSEVTAFGTFVNRTVRAGVHSGTGRTHPADSAADLYPVALQREALTPGTVYADPYGHVMMISKWFEQRSIPESPYGVLMAAEAQPDGTIGRRRFWQGSFLFDPNTRSVGSGFKRLRPLVYDKPTRTLTALDNEALSKATVFPRFSMQQYEGTRADFYDRMDALINPAPLSPEQRTASLVDALEEGAVRRVLAVDNGEGYVREHPGRSIPMPQGADIFETEGPWEDYATPSRDMRLLIAIDTVLDLPAHIARAPERYALPSGTDVPGAAANARAALERALAARSFSYTRSDGSTQSLTLADVVRRRADLEMAYNPNACPEARWGAPAGSPERATCRREVPAEQHTRMLKYRQWFHTRTRPPRTN